MPRSLVMEPTRELADQVAESFRRYAQGQKLNVALLIGGVSFGDQETKLDRGVDVLIATPGRLLDHFERGKLLLTGVQILVVDEADRMLDMGFIPDIERIFKLMPFTRQTLFFSATMPPEITRLTETFLHDPARIEVARPPRPPRPSPSAGRLRPPGPRQARTLRGLVRGADDSRTASSSATASARSTSSPSRCTSTASTPAPSTATWTRARARPRWIASARASEVVWSPPTSPPAASTSRTSATSSTTTSRTTPTTMSTASAAPAAPASRASPFHRHADRPEICR